MSFLLLYFLLGVLFFLGDVAMRAVEGTSFKDQMKASLFLSDDDLSHMVLATLLWIATWPILLYIQSGGPPTRGAT